MPATARAIAPLPKGFRTREANDPPLCVTTSGGGADQLWRETALASGHDVLALHAPRQSNTITRTCDRQTLWNMQHKHLDVDEALVPAIASVLRRCTVPRTETCCRVTLARLAHSMYVIDYTTAGPSPQAPVTVLSVAAIAATAFAWKCFAGARTSTAAIPSMARWEHVAERRGQAIPLFVFDMFKRQWFQAVPSCLSHWDNELSSMPPQMPVPCDYMELRFVAVASVPRPAQGETYAAIGSNDICDADGVCPCVRDAVNAVLPMGDTAMYRREP